MCDISKSTLTSFEQEWTSLGTSLNLGNRICSFGASPFKGTSFLKARITSSICFSFSILLFKPIDPDKEKSHFHGIHKRKRIWERESEWVSEEKFLVLLGFGVYIEKMLHDHPQKVVEE